MIISHASHRYNDSLNNSEKVTSSLTEEKKRNHLLKKQLETLQPHTSRTAADDSFDDPQEIEDIKMQLALQVYGHLDGGKGSLL